ncbi:MAG TPA: VanZ family protein [Gammaproteobacteria bacterium]
MLPLRYRWVWMLLGWLLVAGVCAGSLLPGAAVPDLGFSDKLQHGTSYFLLMVWFAGLYPRARHVWIALVLFALGAGLDLLQLSVASRSFDPRDIAANAAGILIAFALSFWLLEGWCQRMERWFAWSRP